MKKNRPLITVFAVTALGVAACDEAREEEPSRAPPEGTYSVGPRVESVCRGFDGRYFVSIQETNVASAEDGTLKLINENGESSVFASEKERTPSWPGSPGALPCQSPAL